MRIRQSFFQNACALLVASAQPRSFALSPWTLGAAYSLASTHHHPLSTSSPFSSCPSQHQEPLYTMSTFSGNRTIKLWTCCQCRENGISMSLGDCPKCEGHSRCYDCDVKGHAASDAEVEEEGLKIATSAGREPSSARSSEQPSFEPGGSREAGNVTISSGRVARTLPSGEMPSLPRMSSSGLVFYLAYMLQILRVIGHSSLVSLLQTVLR
jgi:hypothetical protein